MDQKSRLKIPLREDDDVFAGCSQLCYPVSFPNQSTEYDGPKSVASAKSKLPLRRALTNEGFE
jgi:hypothetical protein